MCDKGEGLLERLRRPSPFRGEGVDDALEREPGRGDALGRGEALAREAIGERNASLAEMESPSIRAASAAAIAAA
jgi:hypothetical protein